MRDDNTPGALLDCAATVALNAQATAVVPPHVSGMRRERVVVWKRQ